MNVMICILLSVSVALDPVTMKSLKFMNKTNLNVENFKVSYISLTINCNIMNHS